MIYILGYKILDKTKSFNNKNITAFTSSKSFINSNEISELEDNEMAIFQLLQDFDFMEKIKMNNLLNIFIVNINCEILGEKLRTTRNLLSVAKNYTCNLIYNKLNNIENKKKQYITHISEFIIDYDKLYNQELKSNIENYELNSISLEYKIDTIFEYPFKSLLYIYLNSCNSILPKLPNEIIDIINKFLRSKTHINFMTISKPSFDADIHYFITTPALHIEKNILKY
jgi:hypothetical protein